MPSDVVDIRHVDVASVGFDAQGQPVFKDEKTRQTLEQAADRIKAGDLVAFPTETVYGLGANAYDERAVRRIYAAKKRPADNPLIVHVASMRMLKTLTTDSNIPESYSDLMENLWPGPLSLLLPLPASSSQKIAPTATANLPTFVVRLPDHPIARALIALSDVPIAAPSANTSGRPSPTTAEHVATDMRAAHTHEPDWPRLLLLDGGPCGVGVESTVVDGISDPDRLRILRLGGASPETLRQICNIPVDVAEPQLHHAPRTPGQKYRHYAPDARVIVLDVTSQADAPTFGDYASALGKPIGLLRPVPSQLTKLPPTIRLASLGSAAQDNARLLFAGMRALEASGAKVIFVERPPNDAWAIGLGLTVAERLDKAAAGADFAAQGVVKVRP